MLHKIRRVLHVALPVPYVPVGVTRCALVTHRYIHMRLLAAEPRSAAGLVFPSQYLCGQIMLTLFSMVGFNGKADAFLLVYCELIGCKSLSLGLAFQ